VFLRRVELYASVLTCPPLCLGPDISGDCASLLWACAKCFFYFVLLHSFNLLCLFTNALLQMNKHTNSWNSLVINPISKFDVYFSEFCASVGGWK
jgi:hypothetical protein